MQEKMLREQSVQELYLDENGHEMPNPTPMQPAVGYKKQPSIGEMMRQAIRQASLEARQMGAETEEEANDFDVGEDLEPSSPWENDFEPDPMLDHMLALHSRPPQQPAPQAPAPSPSVPPGTPAIPSSGPAQRPLDAPQK